MNQKLTFDLLRLAGLLGFCKDSRNRHVGREIDSVFDTLAMDVSSLLKSYKEVEDQNLKLKQELRFCRCRGPRAVPNGQNDKKRKRTRKSTSTSSGGSTSYGSSGSNTSNSGGAVGYGGGNTGNGASTHNNGSRASGGRSSTGSTSGSSRQVSVPRDNMAMVKAEVRRSGYELLNDQLGRGGFGLVYNGRPLNNSGQEVAIKLTLCDDIYSWTNLPGQNDQIPVEAAALIALESVTSVVDLLGFGEVSLGSDDVFFFVMEKPMGCISFDTYLRQHKPILPVVAFSFLKQLVSMVLAIHQCGWLHGDLKPSNLLMCAQDQLKAIDCGLAKKLVNGQCIVTSAGGTKVWNMAPERRNAGSCDLVKSTVWSVGVMYYYMIFGRLPFSSLKKAQKKPLKWHCNIPIGAKTILQRLLDPDPNRRVVIEDLEQLIQTHAALSNI
ncbi:serine/threonine-protein kinase pim-2-like [Apostichopus japonicus]|uniref:serine/threonine-protein kinase pim-2-like n=1 Tax=Stichopus japonicus TaxID=307972 RepID=UPI003AB5E509